MNATGKPSEAMPTEPGLYSWSRVHGRVLDRSYANTEQNGPKPNLTGCEQLIDGEGIELAAETTHLFTCCDCGLVHDFVIASEDGKPVGFAVRRNDAETAKRRAPSELAKADAATPDAWVNGDEPLPTSRRELNVP